MPHDADTPREPVHFFIHIPKCGGNTFSDFLAKQFSLKQIYTAEKSTAAWEAHRKDIAARGEQLTRETKRAMLRQRFIDGMRSHDLVIENHYAWGIAELLEQHRSLITYVVLREPRQRVASHYLHLRRIPVETAHELAPEARDLYSFAKEASLTQFCHTLERSDIWSTVFNRQTRMMSSQFVSRAQFEQCDKQAFLDDALANLERVSFVACLEDLEEFAHLVSLANRWLPPGHMSVLNPGAGKPSETDELAKEVPAELVELDIVLFQAGQQRYRAWKQRMLEEAATALWRHQRLGSLPLPEGDIWELGFESLLHATNVHGREGTGHETCRWMGPGRVSQLFVPVRRGVPQRLSVFIVAFIDPALFPKVSYHINGRPVSPQLSVEDRCTVVSFQLTTDDTAYGTVELAILAPWTASDRDKGLGNDHRQKSMALRKIRVASLATTP